MLAEKTEGRMVAEQYLSDPIKANVHAWRRKDGQTPPVSSETPRSLQYIGANFSLSK